MKKYVLMLVAIFATFMLSACGGGGGDDTTTTDPVVPSNAVSLVDAGTITFSPIEATRGTSTLLTAEQNFGVYVRYQKNLSDNYLVKVYTESIEITGCTVVADSVTFDPSPVILDGNTNSTALLHITGQVDAACTNVSDYTLQGRTVIQLGDNITEEILSVSSGDINTPDNPVISDEYTFYNSNSPLNIIQPNMNYEISVQLLKGVEIAVGKTVYLKPFDRQYGYVSAYTSTIGADGYARFSYVSPQILPAEGTDANITLYFIDETNATLEENFILHFQNTGEYYLSSDKSITIGQTGTTYPIYVSLWKSETGSDINTSAVGKTVIADYLMPTFGSLTSYEAVIGADGKAVFEYTSPARSIDLNDTNITFYFKDDMSVKSQTQLIFDSVQSVRVEALYILPQTVQVTEAGATQKIQFITVNGDNIGLSAKLQIQQLTNGDGNDYGSFDTTLLTTDASGIGSITYTAPTSIDIQPDRNITVTVLDSDLSEQMTFQYLQPTDVQIYDLTVSVPDSLAVDSTDNIVVKIHKRDDETVLIDPANVLEVNVSVSNFTNMVELPAMHPSLDLYSYSGSNTESINVQTKTISGVAVVDINAYINDGENNITISKSIPLTILSGSIASLSIVYEGTDMVDGLFNDAYTVHAVDRYGNPANPGNQIYPSLICGGSGDTHASDAISFIRLDGEISTNGSTYFKDTTNSPFADVVPSEVRLMILPHDAAYSKDYLGGWTINTVDSADTLELSEDYYGNTTSNIRYIIGDQDRLLNDNISTAHVNAAGGYENFQTDNNGIVKILVVYDPRLVGHTLSLSAVSYDGDTRSGVASRQAFRGDGYIYGFTPSEINIDNQSHEVTLSIAIKPTGEWLDNVYITPASISFDSTGCSLSSSSNLLVSRGEVTLTIETNTSTSDGDTTCTMDWNPSNSSIYYEY